MPLRQARLSGADHEEQPPGLFGLGAALTMFPMVSAVTARLSLWFGANVPW